MNHDAPPDLCEALSSALNARGWASDLPAIAAVAKCIREDEALRCALADELGGIIYRPELRAIADDATLRRQAALDMAIRPGFPEHANTTVERAAVFDRFLAGVDEHPANGSTELTPGVLALVADPQVALRTRDSAIGAVAEHLRDNEGRYWQSFADRAASIVDKLMDVPA